MRALSFGEILWDIIDGKPYIGGAPFNLAAHLAKMGVESAMVSAVGHDELGDNALERVKSLSVDTTFVGRAPQRPTGTVDVRLSSEGQPDYTIHENTAWDAITLEPAQLERIAGSKWDVFCFGTLAQRTPENRKTLAEAIEAAKPDEIVYDVNLRQSYYDREWIERSLGACTILKLNNSEAELLAEYLYSTQLGIDAFCEETARRFEIPIICVTLGADGASVWSNGSVAWVPGFQVDVVDTVGSGDAFTAGFVYALTHAKTPVESIRFACRIGAWVASNRSAVPEYSAEIRGKLDEMRAARE